jgi:hypothetical protein
MFHTYISSDSIHFQNVILISKTCGGKKNYIKGSNKLTDYSICMKNLMQQLIVD